MRIPKLIERRPLWIPTVWGWLVIAVLVLVAAGGLIRNMHAFLAPNQPNGAQLLVVEGWLAPPELDQAVVIYKSGKYGGVATTGGPVPVSLYQQRDISFADLARGYLIERGIPADAITSVPAPASARDRTYLSAVMVREWLSNSRNNTLSINIVSTGAHSRRTQALYRIALGSTVDIGIIAVRPAEYDPDTWWQSSAGAKTVIMEAISWLWTVLFFDPPPHGSHEEKWGRANPGVSAPTG